MPRKRDTTTSNNNSLQTSKRRKLTTLSDATTTSPSNQTTAGLITTVNALSLDDFHAKYWPHDVMRTLFPTSPTITNEASTTDVDGTTPNDPHQTLNLRFKLSSPSTWTSPSEFNACFHLIELMNARDYRASEIGWRPQAKRTEMLDPVMKYLLVIGKSTDEAVKEVRFGGLEVAKRASLTDGGPGTSLEIRNATPDDGEASKIDRTVLGFVSFQVTEDDPDSAHPRPTLYVYEIHLSPRLQNLGIGPRLISLVEGLGRTIGVDKAMLTVFRRNKRARWVYERKCGWEVDESSPEEKEMRNGKRRDLGGYVILSKRLT